MPDWMEAAVIGALGFLLVYFYTRTMGLAGSLPERYVSKDGCRGDREMCMHYQARERDELIERIDRIESKLDRLIERLMAAEGAHNAR